jgi:hypothetical protein
MRKAQGYFVSGQRAFGFDVVDGKKVPNEAEQGLIGPNESDARGCF